MKWFYWVLIFLVFFTPILLIGKGIDHLDIMKDRYKRALDAGANAAVSSLEYSSASSLSNLGNGFGEELRHRNNIHLDRAAALDWFYRVFYRNLNIEKDKQAQDNLKRYIPLKALLSYDTLMIADAKDNWIVDIPYEIEYNGTLYRFTLSERMMNTSTGVWGNGVDFGISSSNREALLNAFIKRKLNHFLNNRENIESSLYYDVNIAVSDIDLKTDDVDGINFIVLAEGLPLPSLNPWKQEQFYAFGLGGSEVTR